MGSRKEAHRHRAVLVGLLTLAGLGMIAANRYATLPAALTAGPEVWPDVALALADDSPTLVLFIHPACPCTRATLHELERAYVEVGRVFHTRFVVTGDPAERTSIHDEVDRIAAAFAQSGRVTVTQDPDGEVARAFAASTSGEAFVYRPDGTLVFQGGLTSARSHEGPNRGHDAIVALMRDPSVERGSEPAYGCGLTKEVE